MSSNAPRPENERGRILPFRRGRLRAAQPSKPDVPVEGVEKYARGEPDDYRQRMINNGLGLLACLVLVAAGIWIASTMAEMRRKEDCVLSGRRNCATIPAPSTGPTKQP
jgi:hypothetical protein